MTWSHVIQEVQKHVVKIATPRGHGTGFLAFYNWDKSWCGIATAAHVVSHADEWDEPIKLTHPTSKKEVLLPANENRVIFIDHSTDSAVVFCGNLELPLPEEALGLLPQTEPCGLGIEIGWLGFPSVEPDTMCFFSGSISARLPRDKAYLIEGVAINGVSGGPVFHTTHSGSAQIIGLVSAYHPNRATGETLPGLLRAQDVSHFHDVVDTIRGVDEDVLKKIEFETQQKKSRNLDPTTATSRT